MPKLDPIPDASFKPEKVDAFWQKKADEYQTFARLSASYSAAIIQMEVLKVTEAKALKAEKPSKPRRAVDIEAKRTTAALELSAPDNRTKKRLQRLIADLEKQLGGPAE
jgi:hypothetical protein